MKRLLSKVLPAAVLSLTLCLALAMLAACAPKDVVFWADEDIMSIDCHIALTLKDDNTSLLEVTGNGEVNETTQKILSGLKRTGTWKMENDQYVVTLGEGDKAVTLTSKSEGKAYTIVYTIKGPDTTVEIPLKYNK